MAIAALFIIISCSRESGMFDSLRSGSSSDYPSFNGTRSLDTKDCIVTLDDINDYVQFKTLISKDTKLVDICSYPDEANPSVYIINYESGWEVISGDKRTAAVIASGAGKFDIINMNSNLMEWIKHLSSEISQLKTTDEETKNALEYITFWDCITAGREFVQGISTTRSGLDTTYHPVPGHYELVFAEESINVIDSINHMVHTQWGQTSPYNLYCPTDRSWVPYYDPEKCYTGCVPLAGGQIVNFYHQNDCCPALYDSAYVNTREYPFTDWTLMTQWHKTPANWSKMHSSDSSRMAAILVANIGKGIEAYYGYYCGSTSASLSSLHDFLLEEYELESYDLSFSNSYVNCYDYIEELLEEGYPSIVGAGTTQFGETVHLNHAFIVDRYKRQQTNYRLTYEFVPDDSNSYISGEQIKYVYHSPLSVYFGMNWGFFGQGDDTWCVKSGDWYCQTINYSNRIQLLTFRCDGEEPGPEGCR